jgi:hypothetical protein
VVAEVWQRLSVCEQSEQKFVMERFNLKELNEGNVREEYQLKITKSSAAVENLRR